MVSTIGFVEAFMEIYNTSAAFLIILLLVHTILIMQKVDRDLLKAKLFLNDKVMQHTWLYISIAGASYSLNTLIRFLVSFTNMADVLNSYYLVDITQLIFLIAFLLTVYNWYTFIDAFRKSQANCGTIKAGNKTC